MEALKGCGYDETVICPHNESHLILKSRLQRHLIRCTPRHPNNDKVTCPFNSTHLIEKKALNHHVENCPDRASFDLYKYKIDTKPYRDLTEVDVEPSEPEIESLDLEPQEDWSDYNVPTYNPEKYCNNARILRTKIGGTPSEKKAFKEAQRNKFKN